MPPLGPQQFDLSVSETYQTKDPAAPIVGTDIQGTVSATVNWNLNRTELTDQGVVFSDPSWLGPGCGPLTVYDDGIGGGLQPVGAVAWSLKTQVLRVVEADTPNKQYRWAITPVVQLIRTITSTIGKLPDTQVTGQDSQTVKGGWLPQP
ncbi:MAG TPA: hypothetical protein VN775_13980 [Opitutaceae bacterium]|nr:hypothetical protein [Opitutaceae bacterium]